MLVHDCPMRRPQPSPDLTPFLLEWEPSSLFVSSARASEAVQISPKSFVHRFDMTLSDSPDFFVFNAALEKMGETQS